MRQEEIDRIEGLVADKAIQDFKVSTNRIIKDMIDEGWEYEDVKKYMLFVIGNALSTHKFYEY
jgi:hypothetical protein